MTLSVEKTQIGGKCQRLFFFLGPFEYLKPKAMYVFRVPPPKQRLLCSITVGAIFSSFAVTVNCGRETQHDEKLREQENVGSGGAGGEHSSNFYDRVWLYYPFYNEL